MALSLELHCKYSRCLTKDKYPEGAFEPRGPIETVFVEDGPFKLPKFAAERVALKEEQRRKSLIGEEI